MLILDNCEHIVATVAEVARDLLASNGGIQILATSRRPLAAIGEAVCRLDPLSDADAVDLFTHRLRAAVPEFRRDDASVKTIATVCRRLDGLPLAIELVVPRLRIQTPDELIGALLDPLWNRLEPKDRQGSLLGVAEWSYALLDPAEQSLFRSLGVFCGWFEAEDASAVSASAPPSVPVLLGSLSEQSMLVQEMIPTLRYRLLDTLQAFALHKLAEAGEDELVRSRRADLIVALVKRMGGPHQAHETRLKLTAMVDDVRTVLESLLTVRPVVALELSTELMPVWRYDLPPEEAMSWNQRAPSHQPAANPATLSRSLPTSVHAHRGSSAVSPRRTSDSARQRPLPISPKTPSSDS